MVLGLQDGYIKYPCFLCMWDSHADKQYYVQHKWPTRYTLEPDFHNVVSHFLVNLEKIFFADSPCKVMPNEKKLWTLSKDRRGFFFLKQEFPHISDGSQIRELLNNPNFDKSIHDIKRKAWHSFKSIVSNHLSQEYELVVNELLNNYQALSARMSIKMHFFSSYLDYFPEDCGDFSEE